MIKARATIGNRDCIIIGLDRTNIDRLLANQPIMFDGGQLGADGLHFILLAGETSEDIREDLRAIGLPIPK